MNMQFHLDSSFSHITDQSLGILDCLCSHSSGDFFASSFVPCTPTSVSSVLVLSSSAQPSPSTRKILVTENVSCMKRSYSTAFQTPLSSPSGVLGGDEVFRVLWRDTDLCI
ncbi:hypothetical protein MDA_GLEAN10017594 [Myotis davidii]|uniref:Uncharacterized protein n=1 Tax=Myotis davidii TaxID=225400 RepID=L5M2F9_MYODS|nr:hypothetical protein MDA_GLEAN10017594 [Myotis davidii]